MLVAIDLDCGTQVSDRLKDTAADWLAAKSKNRRSTIFSQELEIGKKCIWNQGPQTVSQQSGGASEILVSDQTQITRQWFRYVILAAAIKIILALFIGRA